MVNIPLWVLILAIVAVVILIIGMLASATATRLNRMHVRCDLARASLESALGRRAAILRTAYPEVSELTVAAEAVPLASGIVGVRADAENRLAVAVADVERADLDQGIAAELRDSRTRVDLARRFYNDAVTDTKALRRRPLVRILRLAGTAPVPEYFDTVARGDVE